MKTGILMITALRQELDALLLHLPRFASHPQTHDDPRTYYTADVPATGHAAS